MKLENHLIYFDITQICGVGCEFCMYSDKHTIKDHLVLTKKAKVNISKLINHEEIKRVSISGEGEPLNNIKAFKEILLLSNGGIAFEFITSGYISHDKLINLYDEINEIIIKNGDTCNIRLSTDSYHIAKINHKPHAISVKYFLDNNLTNMTFSFRSIDIDKEFTRNYLQEELKLLGIKSKILINDELEDSVIIDNKKLQIDYKNLVKPTFLKDMKYMTLSEYIEAKEKKLNKVFTLGNVNPKALLNGMGITIKPNGDIYFYGIDCNLLANINSDTVDIDFFKNIVLRDKLINTLYTIPFMQLMDKISINEDVKKLIKDVNNPYWIIKEIMFYEKSLLNKMIEND
ncbi:MAG: hypothetical protein A2019_04450 [Sulfurimonas sp. GWF2_37_8]|nr:MAG: hypothetical protein A2019_04450 [Sulfurimonas sp. GWF2_37_8]